MAGHCAAIELAEADAQVRLLEKEPQFGGSTAIFCESFAFAATALRRRNGIEDSPELLFDDLHKVGGYP